MSATMSAKRGGEPLNPVLYALLEYKLGEVKIANEGSAARFDERPDLLQSGQVIRTTLSNGEYYCVCCPFCGDTRFRLWVNYQYGEAYAERLGRRTNTHMAVCYNEHCESQPGRLRQLEDLIFGQNKRFLPKLSLKPGKKVDASPYEPPGAIVSLADLPADHPASAYLRSRNFDPQFLASEYGVGVIVTPPPDKKRALLKNRIYIPIKQNSQLMGWQARVVADAHGPKYFSGVKKSLALYNLDTAKTQPLVVVVEGVPSVWRLGAPAVCTFGNTLSHWQLTTIATTWVDKPVVLMWDYGDKLQNERIEKAVEELMARGLQVIPVFFPDKRDPADYTKAELRAMIAASSEAVGIPVDLSFLSE